LNDNKPKIQEYKDYKSLSSEKMVDEMNARMPWTQDENGKYIEFPFYTPIHRLGRGAGWDQIKKMTWSEMEKKDEEIKKN
jgi:hypothetical protein